MRKDIFSNQIHHSKIIKLLENYYPEVFFETNQDKKLGDLSLLFSLPQFKALLEHSPSTVFILNHASMKYDYFSENIKGLLGYGADRYKKNDDFQFAISTFHPNHALIFSNQIVPKIVEYYNGYSSEEVKNMRFIFTFLCKNSDDKYIWLSQNISVLETDENGHPLFTLVFMDSVQNIKKDEQLDFIITQKNDDGTMTPILATTFLDHATMTFLSKREIEVLKYLSQGLNTYEIADVLSISPDTVANHRKNMLRKTNAKNMVELLNLAMKKGLL